MLAREKFSYDTSIDRTLLSKKAYAPQPVVGYHLERVADQVLPMRGRKGLAQAKALYASDRLVL